MLEIVISVAHWREFEIMDVNAHIVVKGFVQGVGFRFFVYHEAMQLGLHGYVKNLYNGDVEVVAEGDRSVIEEFIKVLRVGPRSAHVRDVSVQWAEYKKRHKGFHVY